MSAPPLGEARLGRRSPKPVSAALLIAFVMLAAACRSGTDQVTPTATTPTNPSTPAPSATSPVPSSLALVPSLPDGCDEGAPPASATVAFVAGDRAWAVGTDGQGLTCLFDVTDPGLFTWGPKADRVVLSGLEVRGVGSNASRPAEALDPADASWGRPTGLALAFVDATGKKLEKAIVGGGTIQDVSPFNNVTYQDVIYHPSGLALGFVLTDSDGSSIWISSNTGKDPKKMVFSDQGTVFGPLAFDQDGTALFYGAALASGEHVVSILELKSATVTEAVWKSDRNVLRLVPQAEASGLLVDAGTDCSDRQALYSGQGGTEGKPLLPNADGPTTAIGWIDESHVLVGEGGCTGPMRLWVVETGVPLTAVLLAEDVDRASLRVADPLPTPALPDIGVNEGAA